MDYNIQTIPVLPYNVIPNSHPQIIGSHGGYQPALSTPLVTSHAPASHTKVHPPVCSSVPVKKCHQVYL